MFENQELNIGYRSGKGDLDRFKRNLGSYGKEDNMNIIVKSSLELEKEELRTITSGLRFASIDGGHWYNAVLNDLRLVSACAASDCVIALDDFFNPDFPEVSAGYYAWMQERPEFVPFCVTKGKMYLCRPGTEKYYLNALQANRYLRFQRKKDIQFLNHELLSFTGRYGGFEGLARQYLSFYAPRLYEKVRRWRGKVNATSVGAAPTGRQFTTLLQTPPTNNTVRPSSACAPVCDASDP